MNGILMLCNPFFLQMRHLRSCSFRRLAVHLCVMFLRDEAGLGRYSLFTDVLLCSTLAHVQYIWLLSVSARACVNLSLLFALARARAHELGRLLGRVRV